MGGPHPGGPMPGMGMGGPPVNGMPPNMQQAPPQVSFCHYPAFCIHSCSTHVASLEFRRCSSVAHSLHITMPAPGMLYMRIRTRSKWIGRRGCHRRSSCWYACTDAQDGRGVCTGIHLTLLTLCLCCEIRWSILVNRTARST